MKEVPWRQDPLAWLLGDGAAADFFREHFERQALVSAHGEPGRFAGLLSLARIDEILASSELPPAALNMARREPPIQRSFYTFANGAIDRGAVIHHFQRGATIILPQLHLADARLADFCRTLEKLFSLRVQTNVYLTPPHSQGFGTHYDDHDVFVLQIAGEKRWQLYQKPLDRPYRGEKFRAAEHRPGHPEEAIHLRPGDCVYVPRGLMHDAQSIGDEPSLHITVGLLGQSWADLMLEAVSEVALRDVAFRRSLPPGYAQLDFPLEDARSHFQALLERLVQQADFEEVFELMREKYLRSRRVDIGGSLLAAADSDARRRTWRLRTNAQVLLRSDENQAVLVSAGGDIHFPAAARDGLEVVLRGQPFDASAFVALDEETAGETVDKLLAFGIIE